MGNPPTTTIPRHLDTLPDLPLQKQLIEHWATYLVDAVLPIPSENNPFRWLITPIALEGARASAESFNAATAVFHLICASSASHLWRRLGQENFLRLSLRHHHLGIRHIRYSLSSTNEAQYISVLAALSMCLLHETLTVGTTFWRAHIRGACGWLRSIKSSVLSKTKTLSTAYQIFYGLVTMFQLQLTGEDAAENDASTIPFHDPKQFYCIDTLYGLSRSTFDALRKMIQLRQQAPSNSNDLDLLEIEMLLSAPTRSESRCSADVEEMMYHQSYMFYYASLIYLKRSIRGAPSMDVQNLVRCTFTHLESMIACTTRAFSPAVWPLAIAAFETVETDLQGRVIKLLDHLGSLTEFDIWPALVMWSNNIWNARQTNPDNPDSQDLPWEQLLQRPENHPGILLV
ncbi:fungal-specific transcription factor domain-containing protein [Aspergillus pseudodeflectus]|uniref:Fungal-specific transcription factor domain-containing protein n=1 Tax=Aspergillus pseudodeflectus TaxID=176178 RepID=A0ABR4KG46_9EURO